MCANIELVLFYYLYINLSFPLSHTPALMFPNTEPEVCPLPLFCLWSVGRLVGWFEIGVYSVAQAGLELTMKARPPSYLNNPPPLASVSTTGMCHTGLCTCFLILVSSLQASCLFMSHPFAALSNDEGQVLVTGSHSCWWPSNFYHKTDSCHAVNWARVLDSDAMCSMLCWP